jgi:hypothetical protein
MAGGAGGAGGRLRQDGREAPAPHAGTGGVW